MRRNVLFIFPPPDRLRETRFGIPLGILYLSSELISAGFKVELADFSIERYNFNRLAKLLIDKDLVGISIPSYSLRNAEKIIAEIRKIKPKIPIAAGGPDCILFPRLVEGTDVTVISEAEGTIVKVFDSLLGGGNLSGCEGVIFRGPATGQIRKRMFSHFQNDLDKIRFPARHLVSENGACGKNLLRKAKLPKSTLLLTSRGCPLHCRFCARHTLSYNKYRERSVNNVLEEVEEAYRAGYRMIWISDDNFGANLGRVQEIMEGIIKMGINISLAFSEWVKSADEATYKLCREAGVRIISFGLESGNQEILDFYKKPITLEASRYAVELANKYDLFTVGNFIFGAPIETKEHLEKTLNFVKSLPLDTVNFKILGYMAGSELWFEAVKKGLIREDERNVFADKNRGLGNFTLNELKEFTHKAYKEFTHNKSRQVRLRNKIKRVGLPYQINL